MRTFGVNALAEWTVVFHLYRLSAWGPRRRVGSQLVSPFSGEEMQEVGDEAGECILELTRGTLPVGDPGLPWARWPETEPEGGVGPAGLGARSLDTVPTRYPRGSGKDGCTPGAWAGTRVDRGPQRDWEPAGPGGENGGREPEQKLGLVDRSEGKRKPRGEQSSRKRVEEKDEKAPGGAGRGNGEEGGGPPER